MSARLESFMASPARGPLPLSPSPDPEELVSRAQAASPNGDSLGGRRAGGVGERFPEKEREKEKEKPDITKAAKFILEYSQITGKCKVQKKRMRMRAGTCDRKCTHTTARARAHAHTHTQAPSFTHTISFTHTTSLALSHPPSLSLFRFYIWRRR
jgi:hypothetical protein